MNKLSPAELRDGLDQIRGKVALIRHVAKLGSRPITSTTASAKVAIRALARCWLMLNEEILDHEKELKTLSKQKAPSLFEFHGIAPYNCRNADPDW